MKRVIIMVMAETQEDTELNPEKFRVQIRSTEDAYFDMYPRSVVMFPDLTVEAT